MASTSVFQNLIIELKVLIFEHTTNILDLGVTCKAWAKVIQDPHARAKWLIKKYGKSYALFHAVRLGPKFINAEVVQSLLSNKASLSRYFIQRLLLHFGEYDSKLTELKAKHNVCTAETNKINDLKRQNLHPWASNLPVDVFVAILNEGYNRFKEEDMNIKGNDMELFHFLSAGPLIISQAERKLKENYELIKELILKMLFIPLPPRPKVKFTDTVEYLQRSQAPEEYPPKDGYENDRQLNVIARAILICPTLVDLWKSIGYVEICRDVNDLVLQGALLILFPPNPLDTYVQPKVCEIVSKLAELTKLGFHLSTSVMADAFLIFEQKLETIGDVMIKAFQEIQEETCSQIASECLEEIAKPGKNLRNSNVLNFLKNYIEPKFQAKVVNEILDKSGVGIRKNEMKKIHRMLDRPTGIVSLTLNSIFYKWNLEEFGHELKIIERCFDDILIARVWIDIQLKNRPGQTVPKEMTPSACKAICSIYSTYCAAKVSFKNYHLLILCKSNSKDVIDPFFEFMNDSLAKDEAYLKFNGLEETKKLLNNIKTMNKTKPYHKQKVHNLILLDWINKLVYMYNNKINSGSLSNFNRQFLEFWSHFNRTVLYNEYGRGEFQPNKNNIKGKFQIFKL
ncbi:12659_t:CDS:1 [Acaulospora colombiana]|uniref:12659_t:CDS:1 n=1 Tax=Acaulospora colombiana TaxID=27376 RepID=A0ACA9JUT2_9GLOM|nr:12659_t:CDS:1 [Acaulospora colombiana]